MSNPTNPFSWQMPTPTDLVTDLPADFEVFGQAVATSLADLLGGTTGQILAKNSNTDMDFVWIANDQGDITGITASSPLTGGGTSGAVTIGIQDGTTAQKGAVQLENSTSSTSTTTAAVPASVKSAYDLANGAIPKSLIDAAGDLIVGTAADTAGRLAMGTAGQVLKVNSGGTALEFGTAGGSGLTLIDTTSFSAVASQSINSVFSSTYTNYQIIFNLTSASASTGAILLRLRASGSDATGSNYFRGGYNNYSNSVVSFYATTTGWQISNPLIAGSGAATMTIYRPNVADTTQISLAATQFTDTGMQYSGNHSLTTAYDGITIYTDGGQTITGTVSIYGYSK